MNEVHGTLLRHSLPGRLFGNREIDTGHIQRLVKSRKDRPANFDR